MRRRLILIAASVVLGVSLSAVGVETLPDRGERDAPTSQSDAAVHDPSLPPPHAPPPVRVEVGHEPHDHGEHDHGDDVVTEVPPDQPARGLVYRGLEPAAADGRCDVGDGVGGMFEMRHQGRFVGCTHGPDPAPPGTDVEEDQPQAATEEESSEGPTTAESISCVGDGVSGYRTQAIYAYRQSAPSRFKTYGPSIRQWASSALDAVFDASAAKTGGDRHLRFVTDPDTCRLDIDVVAMPDSAVDSMSGTVSYLEQNGYTDPNRKYLVWMDANVYCGIGELWLDDRDIVGNYNNGPSFIPGMVARVDAGCWGRTSGTPVEAHELMHNLGGVQNSAPNSTGIFPSPAGGHCTDVYDVMCYDDDGSGPGFVTPTCTPSTSFARLFDCNDDDYFHTSPPAGSYLDTHWNTADSRFLQQTETSPPVPSPPANDDLADADPLSGEADSATGTNHGAGKQDGEPNHAGNDGGASIWFRWTAPRSGPATVTTEGSDIDTLLGVYTGGDVGSLSPVTSNDDRSNTVLTSTAVFDAVDGTSYAIAVDGYEGDIGDVSVQVGFAPQVSRGSIQLQSNKKRVPRGRKVRLVASVPGCDAGDAVRFRGRGFSTTRVLGESCSTTVRAAVRRITRFRAIDLTTGEPSNRVKVRLKR